MKQHSDAQPPDMLTARLEAFETNLKEELAEIVRTQNELLLNQHMALKPLMSVSDVAATLTVSERTVEKLIVQGKLRPLWIKGQRRFHPDVVTAYIRSCEKKPRRTRTQQRSAS